MEILRDKRDSKQKVSKLEEKDIAAYYRKELKRLQAGEITDFESWQ